MIHPGPNLSATTLGTAVEEEDDDEEDEDDDDDEDEEDGAGEDLTALDLDFVSSRVGEEAEDDKDEEVVSALDLDFVSSRARVEEEEDEEVVSAALTNFEAVPTADGPGETRGVEAFDFLANGTGVETTGGGKGSTLTPFFVAVGTGTGAEEEEEKVNGTGGFVRGVVMVDLFSVLATFKVAVTAVFVGTVAVVA